MKTKPNIKNKNKNKPHAHVHCLSLKSNVMIEIALKKIEKSRTLVSFMPMKSIVILLYQVRGGAGY